MNYGIYSILPSLAAIVLALVTKNVFIALFIALILGNFILNPNLVSVLVGTKDMMVDVFSSHSRDEKSRTFSSNSKRSHILRTSSRSRRLILSSIVSLAVSLKCTRTI